MVCSLVRFFVSLLLFFLSSAYLLAIRPATAYLCLQSSSPSTLLPFFLILPFNVTSGREIWLPDKQAETSAPRCLAGESSYI